VLELTHVELDFTLIFLRTGLRAQSNRMKEINTPGLFSVRKILVAKIH
jgi:hypothetical protein